MYRRLVMILVLVTVLSGVQVVGAAGEQTWYFTDENALEPHSIASGITYHKNMTKGVEGVDVTITLAPGERVWFYADELAQCDVTFPAGKWNVSYWIKTLNTTESSTRLTTRLQNVTSGGGYTTIKEGYNTISYSADLIENVESLDAGSFTVPEGGRFAIEILWSSGAAGNLEIHCNPPDKHASNVTSPSSDPGYPVPELSTIILFSTGLLALIGYVLLTKRRK